MSAMKTLSPRELALVVGVSESSMKRWIDAGQIEVYEEIDKELLERIEDVLFNRRPDATKCR